MASEDVSAFEHHGIHRDCANPMRRSALPWWHAKILFAPNPCDTTTALMQMYAALLRQRLVFKVAGWSFWLGAALVGASGYRDSFRTFNVAALTVILPALYLWLRACGKRAYADVRKAYLENLATNTVTESAAATLAEQEKLIRVAVTGTDREH